MEKLIDRQEQVSGYAINGSLREPIALSKSGKEFMRLNLKPFGAALLAASILSACGGGGGGDTVTTQPETGGNQSGGLPTGGTQVGTAPLPSAVPSTASMAMTCVDGAGFQCSGGTIIRSDNGVTLTSSGVQVYGKSTSDLATPNPIKTTASGFTLDSGGLAEIRVAKNGAGAVTTPAVLLSGLGLSWDGTTERPQIIETFRTTLAHVALANNGALTFGALPDPSDLNFYDFATLGVRGTQANYANNSYFPRPASNPPRCPTDISPCPTVETSGVQNVTGDWRTGGAAPDEASATRVHEDGDVHAGNAAPGSATAWLPGGTGIGVPFPGSKGYRQFTNWGYQYANLASWTSQDTVLIEEWANRGDEHNKNRRGFVSYGSVTDPAAVPTTGTATYSGIVYGWYGRGALEEPPLFRGTATVTVNFATRQAVITVANTATYDAAGTAVPAAFTTASGMGAAGSNVASYATGSITSGTLTGGVSTRYYGPVVSTGASGAGPAEIGGAFRMSNASGVAIIGGFIGRKQ